MLRFEPNILHLFKEVPLMERFERAARAGFTAVEFPVPYAYTPAKLVAVLERHGLKMVLMNTPGGDSETQRGLACQPALRPEFRESITLAIRYAVALGRPLLHCPAGIAPKGEDPSCLRDTFIQNLRYAARRCAEEGLSLCLEPINTVSHPGYYLNGTAQTLDLITDIDELNVGILLDFYHMATMREPVLDLLQLAAPRLRHIQVADVPGKGEPGTGGIDFKAAFALLDQVGYEGWIGLEYTPVAQTEIGLTWMEAYAPRPRTGAGA